MDSAIAAVHSIFCIPLQSLQKEPEKVVVTLSSLVYTWHKNMTDISESINSYTWMIQFVKMALAYCDMILFL